jgi:hypothetical protein
LPPPSRFTDSIATQRMPEDVDKQKAANQRTQRADLSLAEAAHTVGTAIHTNRAEI